MTSLRQHALGFINILGGITGSQRPGHGQAVAHATTQQVRDRQTRALAQGIKQRRFHRTLGKTVILNRRVQAGHDGRHRIGISAQQQRSEIGVDGQLHAFRRLGAVGQTTNGRALAYTHRTV